MSAWSALSVGPGCSPNWAESSRRVRSYTSSAAACRSERYRASISCAVIRSQVGCSASRHWSSLISSRCLPSSSSASIRVSSARRRSASSLRISPCAKSSYRTSARGGPRHSASASESAVVATSGSSSWAACRPSRTRAANTSASSSVGPRDNRYPPRTVRSPTPAQPSNGESDLRNLATAIWRRLSAPDRAGPHSASSSTSLGTARLACTRR